ncbi:phosphate propanoyltransferase [Lentilactobacillus fungorum]|jgi:phosphate propanoyltransferase|uniref:Phosphate propanoyltransferase n=1 Tax=Lentilactobacillus fungorum TaxID=2201250 RepID=A0ABQ3VXA9_9LACO|nr:phosphate propanoyltransferase [Lentilactobacillus fungorum]
MEITEDKIRQLIRQVISEQNDPYRVPIGVSNHHIHLSQADFDKLFPGQQMKIKKQLKQPGEFATEQTADIIGPTGTIEHVRVLGPVRSHSQVEIARSECFGLGIDAPIRLSGHLDGTPSVKVRTKDAEITIQGVIVAKRHIHMSLEDAKRFGVKMGDIVSVQIESQDRRTTYDDVVCRPRKDFVLEMHLDTDEASAANVRDDTVGHIVLPKEN